MGHPVPSQQLLHQLHAGPHANGYLLPAQADESMRLLALGTVKTSSCCR